MLWADSPSLKIIERQVHVQDEYFLNIFRIIKQTALDPLFNSTPLLAIYAGKGTKLGWDVVNSNAFPQTSGWDRPNRNHAADPFSRYASGFRIDDIGGEK